MKGSGALNAAEEFQLRKSVSINPAWRDVLGDFHQERDFSCRRGRSWEDRIYRITGLNGIGTSGRVAELLKSERTDEPQLKCAFGVFFDMPNGNSQRNGRAVGLGERHPPKLPRAIRSWEPPMNATLVGSKQVNRENSH
jgi:hypothetical protein